MEKDNVISLFNRDKKNKAKEKLGDEQQDGAELFADVIRRNSETMERLRMERNKANRSVLRSYRIKK